MTDQEGKGVIIKQKDKVTYAIKGPLVYLNSHAHQDRFQKLILKYSDITLDLSQLYFIDTDGIDLLAELIDTAISHKISLLIIVPPVSVYAILKDRLEQLNKIAIKE